MKKKLTEAQMQVMLAAKQDQVFIRESPRMTKPSRVFGGRKNVVNRLIQMGFLKYAHSVNWRDGFTPIIVTTRGEEVLKNGGSYDV